MLIEGVYGLLLEMNLAWTCDIALDFEDIRVWVLVPPPQRLPSYTQEEYSR